MMLPRTEPTVVDLMLEQHAHLEDLFHDVLDASAAGLDRRRLAELWAEFEDALLAHLRAEEVELLPPLQARHPAEVAEVLEAHERIRSALEGLAIAVQLHTVRDEEVRAFVKLMRGHATHEAETVYAYAEEELAVPELRWLLGMVFRAA